MSEINNKYSEIIKDNKIDENEFDNFIKIKFKGLSNSQKEKLQVQYDNLENKIEESEEKIIDISKNELSLLKELFKPENKEEIQNIDKLAEYFNISDRSKLDQVKSKLLKAGLQPSQFLNSFKNHIESKLLWLNELEKWEEYLNKIKESIWKKFINLESEFKTLESKVSDWKSIYDYKWDLDDIIQDSFNSINTELLPSVEMLIKQWWKTDKIKWAWAWVQNDKLEETIKMLESDVLENWDFDKTWESWELIDANTNTWNTFDTDSIIEWSTDSAILWHEWINSLEETSLLSEADKKIEAEATAAIIWYVLAMLVPVAWDIASLPADAQDLLWTQDGLISVLKQSWHIPENYNRVNHLADRILWWVWIIASIAVLVWAWIVVNKAIKSWKLAKYTNRLKKLGIPKAKAEKMIEKAYESNKIEIIKKTDKKEDIKWKNIKKNELLENKNQIKYKNNIEWTNENLLKIHENELKNIENELNILVTQYKRYIEIENKYWGKNNISSYYVPPWLDYKIRKLEYDNDIKELKKIDWPYYSIEKNINKYLNLYFTKKFPSPNIYEKQSNNIPNNIQEIIETLWGKVNWYKLEINYRTKPILKLDSKETNDFLDSTFFHVTHSNIFEEIYKWNWLKSWSLLQKNKNSNIYWSWWISVEETQIFFSRNDYINYWSLNPRRWTTTTIDYYESMKLENKVFFASSFRDLANKWYWIQLPTNKEFENPVLWYSVIDKNKSWTNIDTKDLYCFIPEKTYNKKIQELKKLWYEQNFIDKYIVKIPLDIIEKQVNIKLDKKWFEITSIREEYIDIQTRNQKNIKEYIDNYFKNNIESSIDKNWLITTETLGKKQHFFFKKYNKTEWLNPEIVKRNAKLKPKERIDKASQLIENNFSPEQEKAILEAHNIWKNRIEAGINNYSYAEIKEKYLILKEVWFTKSEIKILMDNGIVGKEPWISIFDKLKWLLWIKESFENKLTNFNSWDIIEVNTWNSVYVFEKLDNWNYKSVWWNNEKLIWNIINKEENIIISDHLTMQFWWIQTSEIKSVNKLEKSNIINDISSAKSIEELLNIIEKKGKIWNYNSDYLIDLIYKYINWVNDVKLENITRTSWLRDTVARLKNNDLIEKSRLRQLWPNWLNSVTKQWNVWNCYFVAWLNTLKNHPNWWNILKDMILIKWNWNYEVNFKWYNKVIIITKNDINEMWKAKIETNNIWDLIIERAHARVINEERWWKNGETFYLKWNDYNHAGWHSDKVLSLLLWDEVNSFKSSSNIKTYIKKWFNEYDFMWLYSKLEKTDKDFYNVKDFNWKNIKIHYSHAYSIKNIDKERWIIDVINPHNSWVTLTFNIKEIENIFSTFFWWAYKKK